MAEPRPPAERCAGEDGLLRWLETQIDADEQRARYATAPPWEPRRNGVDTEIWSVSAHHIVLQGGMAGHESRRSAEHIAAWDPARVLEECAVKRRILGRHALERRLLTVDSPDDLGGGTVTRGWDVCVRCTPNTHIMLGQDIVQWPCPDVLEVAAVYRGRGGWREGWALHA